MTARVVSLLLAVAIPAFAQSPNPVVTGKAYKFE